MQESFTKFSALSHFSQRQYYVSSFNPKFFSRRQLHANAFDANDYLESMCVSKWFKNPEIQLFAPHPIWIYCMFKQCVIESQKRGLYADGRPRYDWTEKYSGWRMTKYRVYFMFKAIVLNRTRSYDAGDDKPKRIKQLMYTNECHIARKLAV